MRGSVIVFRAPAPAAPRWLQAATELIYKEKGFPEVAAPQAAPLLFSEAKFLPPAPEADSVAHGRQHAAITVDGAAPLRTFEPHTHAWALWPHKRNKHTQPKPENSCPQGKSLSFPAFSSASLKKQNETFPELEKAPHKTSEQTELEKAEGGANARKGGAHTLSRKAFSLAQSPALFHAEPAGHKNYQQPSLRFDAAASFAKALQDDRAEPEQRITLPRRALFDVEGDVRLELYR